MFSSPCQTRRNTAESSHGHARREHNLRNNVDVDVDVDDDDDNHDHDHDEDGDDDAYESDKSGKSPGHPSGSRVQEDAHPKTSRFSRIRIRSPSESELSEIVDLSPTRPNAQQTERKSTENDNRNSTIKRNMEVSLPSSPREIDDDPTYNPREVKKWKRIRNGKKRKGKEKKPLSRSLFPQRPSGRSVDDPDYIPSLSDQLPSKRSRLDTVRNRDVGERQESSSAATRLTRSGVRRLENSSYPECSASSSMWSLATSNVNHQYDLRKHIQGNQNTSDNDACDDYVRKTNVQHIRKRTRNVSTTIRMPRDYKDDDSDDDDEQSEDKRKRRNPRANRSHYKDDAADDDDDNKHVGKRKRK